MRDGTQTTDGDEGAGGPAGADDATAADRTAPDAAPTEGPAAALSDRDEAVLAVERRSWPGPGAKERVIRERLGISPTRYYQLLNALLDDPRALAHDPVTVNRLRRIRDARRARR
ncbi:DUF3263 domain-containing protein [Streptomyces gilvosporeus]|uniref:DUF3263 domain-containing protein n=1 Tax=Streptomyces gilvosporeus TaxID=553510 RepID=A0A1V0TW54_9ACTN|nr:DUF3263 domain-containing protein [Streptomyces gilvosporeus]ARF56902.1 hypothetical protein B1H19_24450 [Streptomyces gilvosporeus]